MCSQLTLNNHYIHIHACFNFSCHKCIFSDIVAIYVCKNAQKTFFKILGKFSSELITIRKRTQGQAFRSIVASSCCVDQLLEKKHHSSHLPIIFVCIYSNLRKHEQRNTKIAITYFSIEIEFRNMNFCTFLSFEEKNKKKLTRSVFAKSCLTKNITFFGKFELGSDL